jgi:two-component system, OmpR family, response regulator
VSDLQVLYVDDEPDIREIAGLALGLDPGVAVQAAGSGAEALRMASGGGAPPIDVIMLDVMMPGMDGPAVLEALRGDPATAAIPVVFITARTSTQDRERLLQLGAIAVIAKPFDPMMLAKELRAVLAKEAVA